MVFHKVSIYIHTYIRCKSGRVQRIQKNILKGILLVFPQGIVEDILQGVFYKVFRSGCNTKQASICSGIS